MPRSGHGGELPGGAEAGGPDATNGSEVPPTPRPAYTLLPSYPPTHLPPSASASLILGPLDTARRYSLEASRDVILGCSGAKRVGGGGGGGGGGGDRSASSSDEEEEDEQGGSLAAKTCARLLPCHDSIRFDRLARAWELPPSRIAADTTRRTTPT